MRKGKRNVDVREEGRAIRQKVYTTRAIRQYLFDKVLEILIYSIAGASIALNLARYFNA